MGDAPLEGLAERADRYRYHEMRALQLRSERASERATMIIALLRSTYFLACLLTFSEDFLHLRLPQFQTGESG